MAFGQQAGPPATHRQMQDLLDLVHEAGHDGFRDARGPLGLTQRQAGGRFTRDEADALIASLQQGTDAPAEEELPPARAARAAASRSAPARSASAARSASTARTGSAARPASSARSASSAGSAAAPRRRASAAARTSSDDVDPRLADVASEDLAAELQRRGWAVMEP